MPEETGWISARGVLRSLAVVILLELTLVGASGVWPPMLAVESGSMSPHIATGDLVVVAQPGRWTASAATPESAIVTYQGSDNYERFGDRGDVIVFDTPHWERVPIIHRARFHVSKGENWYDRGNKSYMPDEVDGCDRLRFCPAPHDGYITKGDDNPYYDQARGRVGPVKAQWVQSKAAFRLPDLGWGRLFLVGKAKPPFGIAA